MGRTCNHSQHSQCCSSKGERSSPFPDEVETNGPHDDGQWQDWPCCPQCGRRRQTFCPTCDLGGDDFPLAEFIPTAAPLEATRSDSDAADQAVAKDRESVLLMCPTCDEAFTPGFYRLCEQCGHDFGDGLQVKIEAREELTGRMLFVLAGLAALAIVILIYFWWLFS